MIRALLAAIILMIVALVAAVRYNRHQKRVRRREYLRSRGALRKVAETVARRIKNDHQTDTFSGTPARTKIYRDTEFKEALERASQRFPEYRKETDDFANEVTAQAAIDIVLGRSTLQTAAP